MASNSASNSTDNNPQFPFVPGKLISHLSSRPAEQQAEGWASLWDANQNDMWDRGKPSPALIDLLEGRTPLGKDWVPRRPGAPAAAEVIAQDEGKNEKKRRSPRPRALVPGCGKGYDVVMLALHGYDVYGLEVSAKGVETAKEYAEMELRGGEEPGPYNYGEGGKDEYPRDSWGKVKILAGDFFKMDWEEDEEDGVRGGGFDLIYDYTFLCALLPKMRKDWARRMGELLAPEGVLVCLEFPLYKDLKLPGPPWGLREGIYWDLLACGGGGVFESDQEAAEVIENKECKGKLERVARITPARSHEVSKGTDRLSVWRLKKET